MTALLYDTATFDFQKHENHDVEMKQVRVENPNCDKLALKRSLVKVGTALEEHLDSLDANDDTEASEKSLFVCDLGEVYRLLRYWQYKLPRVKPHYAIKCNTDIEVIKLLAAHGCNFDCASKVEMETILALGVDASRIVFSNPCKFSSHLRFARDVGVNLTVFDNEDELVKIARVHPKCRVLLRIETDDAQAVVRLSTKYGCKMNQVEALLLKAKELGVNLVGVHFHCGSGSEEVSPIVKAVEEAKRIFVAATELGFDMRVLDVGGGFMIDNHFDNVAAVLNHQLSKHFPPHSGVEIISEPGRFFVTTAFTLASSIIGKRGNFGTNARPMVYISDGIYTNMNCVINDHYVPRAQVLTCNRELKFYEETECDAKTCGKFPVEIWGQTCDSADFMDKDAYINYPVTVGDWLFFRNMGAYTLAATTSFNGFSGDSRVIYVSSEDCVKLT